MGFWGFGVIREGPKMCSNSLRIEDPVKVFLSHRLAVESELKVLRSTKEMEVCVDGGMGTNFIDLSKRELKIVSLRCL